MGDSEIEAMSAVVTALAELDQDAQARVLHWAAERYGVTTATRNPPPSGGNGPGVGRFEEAVGVSADGIAETSPTFEHFAELFAKAQPKSDVDKALIAAYWVQINQGEAQWQARSISRELKHLGHSLSNVTKALAGNMSKKPQLVIQLRKAAGTSGNKTYKVTNAGITYVQGMLSSGHA